jgi:glycosyltransferase involved in cell wall biosynthesis
MSAAFDTDVHPGQPRILFIGPGDSTHTHSWIDLLENEPFNVRLFVPPFLVPPPEDWKVRTYVPLYYFRVEDPATRMRLFDRGKARRLMRRFGARLKRRKLNINHYAADWLVSIVERWRPQIIHTFSLEAAEYFFPLRQAYPILKTIPWVLQLRGGADLAWAHCDPGLREKIGEVLRGCDQLLSDNTENFRIARELGVSEDQLSRIGTVPGTGGIDIKALSANWNGPPSTRRIILWPKVYEWPWSKALPVFEALKICWEQIQPCQVEMLATTVETKMYYWTLPDYMRSSCVLRDRVPRRQALEAMTKARVMLAPSLVDGTPNSMFEAMAAGALPIVSPLDTIRPLVEDELNVLFARNLYPEEIAAALVRAMNDDLLVDAVAQRNLELVTRIASRDEVRARVVSFYRSLAETS